MNKKNIIIALSSVGVVAAGALLLPLAKKPSENNAMPTVIAIVGDVNLDGKFDVSDSNLMSQYLMGLEDFSLQQASNADIDNNGDINAIDLTLLKRHYLGTLPQESEPVTYEAEDAEILGSNSVQSDSNASGGKAVGNFANDGDTVTFTIDIPESGLYDLCFTASGIGGQKENGALLDGQYVGSFVNAAESYSQGIVRSVSISAGEHTVSIQKSWGWIKLDKLTVIKCQGISDEVFNVDNKLINPNANQVTQNLFNYLSECYGNYTLAGQVCDDGINGPEFAAIYSETGKYPAMLGLDMMDYSPSRVALGASSDAVDQAIDFWNEGGIVTFCWHWNAPTETLSRQTDDNGSPSWWGGFYTRNTNLDISAVMNGNDPVNKQRIDEDIKAIADQLLRLQEEGVPVLWRPLHEASGGWFWWGAKGSDAYKQLWIYMYEELTNTYGCNNLIWVWNGQNADWYPGDEYVDIIGEDIYPGEHVYSPQTSKFMEALEYSDSKKIVALTENGCIFDIDEAYSTNTKWAWFNTWCGEFTVANGAYSEKYTEKEILKKAYDSEYVITLDELPDFN